MRSYSPSARRSTSSVLIVFDGSLGAATNRKLFAQNADVAQLAEQPPRKWQVVSSNLTVGSTTTSVRSARPGRRDTTGTAARIQSRPRHRPKKSHLDDQDERGLHHQGELEQD